MVSKFLIFNQGYRKIANKYQIAEQHRESLYRDLEDVIDMNLPWVDFEVFVDGYMQHWIKSHMPAIQTKGPNFSGANPAIMAEIPWIIKAEINNLFKLGLKSSDYIQGVSDTLHSIMDKFNLHGKVICNCCGAPWDIVSWSCSENCHVLRCD